MSKYLVYISFKPFIAQWLRHHFGDPVVFPAQSAENACIRHFLTRQPGSLPLTRGDDDVAICIPDSKQKPVVTYNYLSGNARKAVAECIEDTFRLQLWPISPTSSCASAHYSLLLERGARLTA